MTICSLDVLLFQFWTYPVYCSMSSSVLWLLATSRQRGRTQRKSDLALSPGKISWQAQLLGCPLHPGTSLSLSPPVIPPLLHCPPLHTHTSTDISRSLSVLPSSVGPMALAVKRWMCPQSPAHPWDLAVWPWAGYIMLLSLLLCRMDDF